MKDQQITAVSLFTGAGGMDVGFEAAGASILWANEFNRDAANTYYVNHKDSFVVCEDIRTAKESLKNLVSKIDVVFGGPPCQGFSVAGKMDPNDERSTMVWEFLDVVRIIQPRLFVMENVKALGQLSKWASVRNRILWEASVMGYECFYRVLNSSDFGVPQNRERVFFIGIREPQFHDVESQFDQILEGKHVSKKTLRDCLLSLDKAGTPGNPITCSAKITLATNPVLRKSPYAGMLFNGMGRPLNLDAQSNTLPASMGGNKTPIVDENYLYGITSSDWVSEYHHSIVSGVETSTPPPVPSFLRRLTINEAAAIQTFPIDYQFVGEKTSIYRQIGNAVPCNLAKAVAETALSMI